MELKLTTRSLRLLDVFVTHAPSISLARAYDYVKEHQEMDNDLGKYEFIILQLFKALGFNDNGYLNDSKMAKHLEALDNNEIWQALNMASAIHCATTSGLPNPPERKPYGNESLYHKELERIEEYKRSQLSITLKERQNEE